MRRWRGSSPQPLNNEGIALVPVGFFAIVRAWLRLIIVGAFVGAIVSLVVSLVTPATYVGKVTLIVTPISSTGGITFSDVEVTQALAPTFAELSTTTPLLQRVIADTSVDLDPEALAKVIETHVPVGTSLIDISVSQHDPDTAARLANAIATELEKYPGQGSDQISSLRVSLTVVDPAVAPRVPEGFGIPLRTALGGAVGILLAVSLAFFVENLGRGVQSLGRGIGPAGPPAPGSAAGGASAEPAGGRHDAGLGSTLAVDDRTRAATIPPVSSTATPLSQTIIRPLAYPAPDAARRFMATDRTGGAPSPGAALAPLRLTGTTGGSALPASSVHSAPMATANPTTTGSFAPNPPMRTTPPVAPAPSAVAPDPRTAASVATPAVRPSPPPAAAGAARPLEVPAPAAPSPSIIVPAAKVAASRPATPAGTPPPGTPPAGTPPPSASPTPAIPANGAGESAPTRRAKGRKSASQPTRANGTSSAERSPSSKASEPRRRSSGSAASGSQPSRDA